MDVETWLEAALADAERRGLPGLKPLLTGLARSTRVLRDADWNEHAGGVSTDTSDPGASTTVRPIGSTR